MAFSSIDKGSKYFNTVLWTGDGSTSKAITGVGFKPDFVWLKQRSASTYYHRLQDAVRGAGKTIYSNSTDTEGDFGTGTGGSIRTFDTDGFTIGSEAGTNTNGVTMVSWNWLGANTTASNTSGTITSTVSANTTSGFSIVGYTGNGSNSTIGHGLGVAPAMVIIKDRDSVTNWSVNHQPLCASLSDYSRYMTLDSTSAVSGAGNTHYQNTAFTSTVFNVGTSTYTNNNTKKYIAYCFANVKGFSKFGSYSGNSSADGTYVYLGFAPAFVMVKETNFSGNEWSIADNKRNGYNVISPRLSANTSNAETTATNWIDFLSNGFKLRSTNIQNSSGSNYIYMAFAENPFVSSKGLPVTAR